MTVAVRTTSEADGHILAASAWWRTNRGEKMKAFAIAVSVLVLKALVAAPSRRPFGLADSGWWDDSGTHDASNEVILAGDYRGREYRGFYVFNLFNMSSGDHCYPRFLSRPRCHEP